MAEGVVKEIVTAPKQFLSHPVVAISIGVFFLLMVLLLEAFKPGLVTGPFKSFLRMVGVKGAV
jgi:hypothetical protein